MFSEETFRSMPIYDWEGVAKTIDKLSDFRLAFRTFQFYTDSFMIFRNLHKQSFSFDFLYYNFVVPTYFFIIISFMILKFRLQLFCTFSCPDIFYTSIIWPLSSIFWHVFKIIKSSLTSDWLLCLKSLALLVKTFQCEVNENVEILGNGIHGIVVVTSNNKLWNIYVIVTRSRSRSRGCK